MLYNEYSSLLYYQRIQYLIESHTLYCHFFLMSRSHLHINELLSLPSKLPRPVTKDKCCYARQIRSTQFSIHPSPRVAAVFIQHVKDYGLSIHEDSAKFDCSLYIMTRNTFALFPVYHPTAELAPGMMLNDSTGVEDIENPHIVTLSVEGIEYCYLFCIPSKLSFTLITQFQPQISNTSTLFETICKDVTQWTERFYHEFTEVASPPFSDL